MAVSRHSIIAKEGWLFISVSLLCSVVAYYFYHPSLYFFLPLTVLVFWIFRDPVRKLSSEPLGIVSPVDGEVISVDTHPDPYLGRDACLIRICTKLTDVFSIRSVIEGKIVQQWLDPEEDDDERSLAHAIQIQTDEKDDIVVVLRPGRILKKLSCDAVIGERIGQGARCGFIPFGACIDVYVPLNSTINVQQGDNVLAGVSTLVTMHPHVKTQAEN